MAAYILRRLIQSALILLGVSFITFFLLFVYKDLKKKIFNLFWMRKELLKIFVQR